MMVSPTAVDQHQSGNTLARYHCCWLVKRRVTCRRHKEAQAIYMADDGQAPPLYCKANLALQWGSLYGTEHLDPSGLRKWKAKAVRLLFITSMICHDIHVCL